MDNVVLASTYRSTATIFRMSAVVLVRDFQERGEALPRNIRAIPFYYLISHAIELLLKCALLKRGQSADDLKRYPVRHSLDALLQKLRQLGMPLSDGAIRIIGALSRQHEKHNLRYTVLLDDGEFTFTPELSELFALLDELLLAGRVSTRQDIEYESR
jgi:hypothetical protein